MKKVFFPLMILFITAGIFPQCSFAKTGYVSDMLFLTFRQGPGNSYEVIKTLPSNTEVSVLDEENGFYKVELVSDEIGWVDKKFIVFEPTSTILFESVKQENQELENKISQLERTGLQLEKDIDSLKSSLKQALDEKNKLDRLLFESREKYNILIKKSADIHKLINENKSLMEENTTLKKQLEARSYGQTKFFKPDMIKWFLYGVVVLLLGWIIGRSVSTKKRGSGYSGLS